MKKLFILTVMALLVGYCGNAAAQPKPGYTGKVNPNCIGLKNPTNFTLSGSHQEKWTGYTGSKNEMVSTCYMEAGTYDQTIQARSTPTVLA